MEIWRLLMKMATIILKVTDTVIFPTLSYCANGISIVSYCVPGRQKELIITAGGENVAPVPIEDQVKAELPIVSNAILVGDLQRFLSVFLTLKTVVDLSTMIPTRELTPSAIAWCENLGRYVKTVDDVLNGPDPVIMSAIQVS